MYLAAYESASNYGGDDRRMSTGSIFSSNQPQRATSFGQDNASEIETASSAPHNTWPLDEEFLHEIRKIISKADLMTMTKKQVRETLEHSFGMNLKAKEIRDKINQWVDDVLSQQ